MNTYVDKAVKISQRSQMIYFLWIMFHHQKMMEYSIRDHDW